MQRHFFYSSYLPKNCQHPINSDKNFEPFRYNEVKLSLLESLFIALLKNPVFKKFTARKFNINVAKILKRGLNQQCHLSLVDRFASDWVIMSFSHLKILNTILRNDLIFL